MYVGVSWSVCMWVYAGVLAASCCYALLRPVALHHQEKRRIAAEIAAGLDILGQVRVVVVAPRPLVISQHACTHAHDLFLPPPLVISTSPGFTLLSPMPHPQPL